MAAPRDRGEALSEPAAALARQLVAERFPPGADGPRTLAEREAALAAVKREWGEPLPRRWIEPQEPAAETRTAGAACPGRARFGGRRERLVVTRHGEWRFRRRSSPCPGCPAGFAPLDPRLGLDGQGTTAPVRAWRADRGGDGACETAARRRELFTARRWSESTAARTTGAVGRRRRAEELAEAERLLKGEAVPRRTRWPPQRRSLSCEGSMTPRRDPWQREGSQGPLQGRSGEGKTAVGDESRRDRHGNPVVARRQDTATREAVAVFEKLVVGLAYQCGSDQAAELVVLAAGRGYNGRIAAAYFPEALPILAFYQALEHRHTRAGLCLPGSPGDAGAERAAAWVTIQTEQRLPEGVAAVTAALQALPVPTPAAREYRAATHGSFSRKAARMRSRTFLAAGSPIGSGVMAAACQQVAHQRLDPAGRHGRPETADAVVALRANQLSHSPRDLRPYCGGWS